MFLNCVVIKLGRKHLFPEGIIKVCIMFCLLDLSGEDLFTEQA